MMLRSTTILYSLLYLCIWLSHATSCTFEIHQEPPTVMNVPPRSPVQFTCLTDYTCNISIIFIQTYDSTVLMMRNSSYYNIPNNDIEFQGNLTKFAITMKVNSSTYYYCVARMNGKLSDVKSNGTLITVNEGAGLTVSRLLFLPLISLVCIYVGI